MHYDIAEQEMLKQEGITIVSLNRHFSRLRNKTVHVQVILDSSKLENRST